MSIFQEIAMNLFKNEFLDINHAIFLVPVESLIS